MVYESGVDGVEGGVGTEALAVVEPSEVTEVAHGATMGYDDGGSVDLAVNIAVLDSGGGEPVDGASAEAVDGTETVVSGPGGSGGMGKEGGGNRGETGASGEMDVDSVETAVLAGEDEALQVPGVAATSDSIHQKKSASRSSCKSTYLT